MDYSDLGGHEETLLLFDLLLCVFPSLWLLALLFVLLFVVRPQVEVSRTATQALGSEKKNSNPRHAGFASRTRVPLCMGFTYPW
jgi:hypothetical protein